MIKILLTLLLFASPIFAGYTTYSGRVVTELGTGVNKAVVTANVINFEDCSPYQISYALTNPFGYYSIVVPDDCSFFVYPGHKNYTVFSPATDIIIVLEPSSGPFTDKQFIAVE